MLIAIRDKTSEAIMRDNLVYNAYYVRISKKEVLEIIVI